MSFGLICHLGRLPFVLLPAPSKFPIANTENTCRLSKVVGILEIMEKFNFFVFLFFMFFSLFLANIAAAENPEGSSGLLSVTDPLVQSEDGLIPLNRKRRTDLDPTAAAAQGIVPVPTLRQSRGTEGGLLGGGLLGGLPLPTAALITKLLITLNNVLSQFELTVVLLPSPFPLKMAKCIPGCLKNPDCITAITKGKIVEQASNPIQEVLGILNLNL